jgi:hypothetical protein
MSIRRSLVLVVLVALLGACASEGLPSSYDDQDGRAQRQFVEACQESLAGTDEPDPAGFCECAYYTVAAELTWTQFLELDEKLKDDAGALSLEERRLLESVSLPCAFGPDDVNATVVG